MPDPAVAVKKKMTKRSKKTEG